MMKGNKLLIFFIKKIIFFSIHSIFIHGLGAAMSLAIKLSLEIVENKFLLTIM